MEDSVKQSSRSLLQPVAGKDMSEEDTLINATIQKECGKTAVLNWPYTSKMAISEYGQTTYIFCKAFPWLFPGGLGDFSQYNEENWSFDKWSIWMLHYEDGHFAKDKMWCFYALNVCNRKWNQSSGGFFVNSWYEEGQKSLEEIQQEIKNGNTKWIDWITYYGKRVQGSSGYWRNKREEVYSWINHHVVNGNGPPNFFITLSCAEYHWPDINVLQLLGSPRQM